MGQTVPADIIGKLREAVVGFTKSKIYGEMIAPRDAVLARFQPVFCPDHAPELSEEEFRSFLLFENNRHWTGLHRQGSRMCSDMDRLRKALGILLDEKQPVNGRLDSAIEMVTGMGKNVATAILLVLRPDQYGVWNNRSEANMKRLGIWPTFERGEPFGQRYEKVNAVLQHLRTALDVDLWTLDGLWFYLDEAGSEEPGEAELPPAGDVAAGAEQRFGLERHLHEFLRDNWNRLELGQEWALHQEPGDEEAGYEYPCAVGRIDILAKHRTQPRWLVVELKRNQTSDQTVGQLLRYIGWVTQHLAQPDETVHGLIICREADDALRYALSMVPNAKLRLYRVEFHLVEPE